MPISRAFQGVRKKKEMCFMRKVFITLSSIDDVKVFVNEINLLPCDADLVSGRYTVDAKSIMGIFSLDLSKPIELDIHSDDDAACDAFLKKIASFVTSE
jgi:hypothetical protein